MADSGTAKDGIISSAMRFACATSELFRGFCRRISNKNEAARIDIHAFTSGNDDSFIHLVFYEGGELRVTSRHYRFSRTDWENLYLLTKERQPHEK